MTALVDAVAAALLHFLWQGLLLGALAWLAMRLAPESDARTRHRIALWSLAAMLIVFLGTIRQQFIHGQSMPLEAALSVLPTVPLAEIVWTPRAAEGEIGWRSSIVLAWTLVVLLKGIHLLRSFLSLRRIYSEAASPDDPRWQLQLDAMSRSAGIGYPVRILVTQDRLGPALVGIWKPVVIFPVAALNRLNPQQVEAVLAHELAHLVRRDHWVNVGLVLVDAALFFHPVTWWLRGVVRSERELCCDSQAVHMLNEPRNLAEALTLLEAQRLGVDLSVPAQSKEGHLMRRIQQILQPASGNNTGAGGAWLPLVMAGALLSGSAAAISAAPEPTAVVSQDPVSDYAIVQRRIKAAVSAGLLSREEAQRVLDAVKAAMKSKPGATDTARDGQEARRMKYAEAEKRLKAAVEAGEVSREAAEERMKAMRKRLTDSQVSDRAPVAPDKELQRERRMRYAEAERRMKEAVDSGEISADAAKERLAELRKRLEASRQTDRAAGAIDEQEQRARRMRYAEAERRIKEAVKAGKATPEQAEARLAELRKRMADSAGPDRAASMEERKREYERAEREIMKMIETGKVSGEDGKRRLGELRRRMFGEKETDKVPSMEQRKKRYEQAAAKIREAVGSGKITPEEGEAKLRSLREELFGSDY